jgi:CheY-like chemotaxis protein
MHQACVLLIEDNPADVVLTREALSNYPCPIRLTVATDGDEALETLTRGETQPTLIILDLNMARMDGQAFLEQYANKTNVPIIVFSSTRNQQELDRAIRSGARECILKPIGFARYAAAVRGILDRWLNSKDSSGNARREAGA